MGREILQRIALVFDEEDKDEVLEIINKLFWREYKILTDEKDYFCFEVNYGDLEERDFEELKEICYNISLSEYEYLEGEGFFWEREDDDDDLQKTMRKKLRQIKKNGNKN